MNILPLIRDSSVDAVITDPPYNATNRETDGLRQIDKGTADSEPVNIPVIAQQLIRISSGSIYVWCDGRQMSYWIDEFDNAGLTVRYCAWVKTNPPVMNGEYLWLTGMELCVFARKPNAPFLRFCEVPVWTGPSERVDGIPTPKPVWLMEELVTASVPKGGSVLDPYMGGGSTGIACVRHGVNFMGIDKYPLPYSIAERRITKEINRPRQASIFDDFGG